MTQTIELTIPEDLLKRIDDRVRQYGGDRNRCIRRILEKEFPEEVGTTFDEIAAPLRQDFKASGMTEEEFDALIEEAREEVWQEKRSRSRAS